MPDDTARRRLPRDQAARLARRQRQEAARLRKVAETALALNTTLAPDAILHVLAQRARALVGAHVAIAHLEGEDGRPSVTAVASSTWHLRGAQPSGGPGVHELAALGRTAAAHHATLRLTPAQLRALARATASDGGPARVPRGWLAAPLVGSHGKTIGLIQLWDKPVSRGPVFSDEDEAVLAQLAHVASIAAENARLLREAQDALQARDDFLAGVTHDLRNPLASIRGYAQMLLRQERKEAEPRPRVLRALQTIDSTTTRIERMVDELLDVARVRAGQPLDLDRESDDLVPLVRDAVTALQAATETHTLRLETNEAELVGEWDTQRLLRVLDNVVGNAIKYSPGGGEVVVTLERHAAPGQPAAVLRVRDHGVGVPEADLPRIFQRFARGSNVQHLIPGVGIGLAGARQIVEQHGGTIEVESQEGHGTTFTIRLPLVATGALARPATSVTSSASGPDHRPLGAAGGAAIRSGRVLVVEDDDLTRRLLRETLRDEGYEVIDAEDGESALRAARRASPDLILLDLRLPVLDGAGFARRYHRETPAPAPIIIVTATEGELGEAVPAAAIVSKPFLVDDLVRLVEHHAAPRAA